MPKQSYQLVNPVIEGTFKDVYDASTPIDAAKLMWENLTEHIVSHVPKFMFTMKNISSDKFHHFEVSENGKTGSFIINTMKINTDKNAFTDFIANVDKYSKIRKQKGGEIEIDNDDDKNNNDNDNDNNNDDNNDNNDDNEQNGGGKRKRYDDSSSSSSSSSTDIYPTIRRTSPIAMFHYNTRVYYTNGHTYASTLNPQVVGITTPLFTPIFRPMLGTFVGIWP